MKDSFVFYTEYAEVLDVLTAEQAGLLIRAMVKYSRGERPDLSDKVVKAVFMTIKPRMDKDREKWEQTVAARVEAGKKGGAPKGNQNASKTTKNNQKQPKQATQAVSDPDPDCEVDNNPPKSPQRGKRESQIAMFDRLIAGRAVNSNMEKALREWIVYKTERNERYKEAGMQSLITQCVNHGAAHGGESVCNVIRESMANGYKGIVWDRLGKAPPGRTLKPPERTYDMNELELKLLATN